MPRESNLGDVIGGDVLESIITALYPECTLGLAAIGDDGEDVLAVWKWRGERDWIPMTQVVEEITDAVRKIIELTASRS